MRRPVHAPSSAPRTPRSATNVLLWAVQIALAALFLFAGGMKLVVPLEALAAQSPLPGAFLRVVGVLEVLGALGLVVPGLLRLRGELTALAAGGLVLLMCGAVGATLATPTSAGTPAMAIIPAAVGALAAVVAWGRARPARGTAAATPAARALARRIAAWPAALRSA